LTYRLVLAILDSVLANLPRFRWTLDPLIAEAARRARQRRLLVCFGLVVLAGVVALLTVAFRPSGGAGSSAAQSYLYRYGDGEWFIHWQRHGQHLHGTISDTQLAACGCSVPPGGESGPVSGTISGKNVALHLPNGVTWVGTLTSSGGLVIRNASPSGAPLGERFRPATVADYNTAIAHAKAFDEGQRKR
jgi:hypothetical protein